MRAVKTQETPAKYRAELASGLVIHFSMAKGFYYLEDQQEVDLFLLCQELAEEIAKKRAGAIGLTFTSKGEDVNIETNLVEWFNSGLKGDEENILAFAKEFLASFNLAGLHLNTTCFYYESAS